MPLLVLQPVKATIKSSKIIFFIVNIYFSEPYLSFIAKPKLIYLIEFDFLEFYLSKLIHS
ncbi:hypothetical protein C1E23_13075 [Pseudoalteromonas phenolica]|uniref:Uncharacterized protein n=1 Tax=Pseudoalteromonas phenolica TaxID=161398 RepID=A0A4Q7INU1_9GAMM|nr:hypothetical protein C1E23_13075 [Pseudoalteromonas phenolica]